MKLLLDSKNINKPWKVALWLYGVDGILRIPLRFSRSYFSLELDLFLIIRGLIFLIAIFLVGVLYVKSTKEAIGKPIRFKVSLYVAFFTLAVWLFFTFSFFGEFFVNMFGGLVEGILATIITFLSVYFILPLGNRFMVRK